MSRRLFGLALVFVAAGCQVSAAKQAEVPHELVRFPAESLVDARLTMTSSIWVGPVIEAAHPFDEVLPSWNVDVPEGSAFTVELSVRDEAGWSPWLLIGSWGSPQVAEFEVSGPDGRVDVDLYRSESSHAAGRLRLRAFGLRADQTLRIRSMTMCFTDTKRLGEESLLTKPPTHPPLQVPLYSQRLQPEAIASRICSPTSVAMLLAYRGKPQQLTELAAEIYDAEHDIYGNWNRAVQSAWTHGVPGYLTRINTWDEAGTYTDAGQPLIISIRAEPGQLQGAPYPQTSGHLLVLLGFPTRTTARVADPAAPELESVERTYSLRDLDTVWLRRSGVAYVLQAPADELPPPAP